ncbi:uncharacterized protein BX664DRAFT_359856 [Halteromyces radiatus]|uniref:uncharacterized protein n=1 Tax=Halteromyces radiatus TaxID=101107 RepID=UPI00222056E2|nr:uncharacterized protein BX664DRAFT_359856 [Halteromyces radiatus]KAI8086316.1 hypothetical protein BX664DRAFT_359856 [Halteromyces radiatus]
MRYAIGYCEVKTCDTENNVESIHMNLFRLANFCKNSIDKGYIKALMAIQVVESVGHYVMFELGRLDIPLTYEGLPQFIMKLDFLKKLCTTYMANCIERTENNSSMDHSQSQNQNGVDS